MITKNEVYYKRDALVKIARGKYLTFVDDDDDITSDYFEYIMPQLQQKLDKLDYDYLVAFNSIAYLNGVRCNIIVDKDCENEEVVKDDNGDYKDCKRQPFHVCVWRTSIAQSVDFEDMSYGEDWAWSKLLIPQVETWCKIDRFLHIYRYDSEHTEAPTEKELTKQLFKILDEKNGKIQ